MNGKQFLALLMVCALAAFSGSVVGTHALVRASAQTPPLGNGGPTLCDGTTLVCANGAVALNPAASITWTGTPTFSNGFTDNGTTAFNGATTVSGNATFQTGTLTLSNGASLGAPLTFSQVAMTAPSTAAVYSNASGDLVLQSISARIVSLQNKLSVGSAGVGMNLANLSGMGHEGTNTACSGTGTFTISSVSGDNACEVTLASGVATVTFHAPYSVKPVCNATDTTAANTVKVTPSTTGYTLAGTTSDVIDVRCIANGGI